VIGDQQRDAVENGSARIEQFAVNQRQNRWRLDGLSMLELNREKVSQSGD
jgi:hypothetical protein